MTSSNCVSLSGLQLLILPNGSENPCLLEVKRGRIIILLLCAQEQEAWESFREEPQLARPEELASWEGVGPRVGSFLLRPAQILGADPCLAQNQRAEGGLYVGPLLTPVL